MFFGLRACLWQSNKISFTFFILRVAIGERPLSRGLSPLEKRPPDVFQFTPCPSSFKAFCAAAQEGVSRSAERDQRALPSGLLPP